MISCNSRNREVRLQSKKRGKITGKSMQKTRINNWKNQFDRSHILCITYKGKEPQRLATVKRVQLKKLVVTVFEKKKLHQYYT